MTQIFNNGLKSKPETLKRFVHLSLSKHLRFWCFFSNLANIVGVDTLLTFVLSTKCLLDVPRMSRSRKSYASSRQCACKIPRIWRDAEITVGTCSKFVLGFPECVLSFFLLFVSPIFTLFLFFSFSFLFPSPFRSLIDLIWYTLGRNNVQKSVATDLINLSNDFKKQQKFFLQGM